MSIKVFKTYTFKCHNLSNSKKAKIYKSMKQATMTFYKLIEAGKDTAEKLVADIALIRSEFESRIFNDQESQKEAKTESHKRIKLLKIDTLAEITRLFANIVRPLPFGCALKDGAVVDAVAQISSFVELIEIGQKANLPRKFDAEIDYHLALNQLLTSTCKEDEEEARNTMLRSQKKRLRPITLSRYRETRIIADNRGRLFALPYLWSAQDQRANRINIDATDVNTTEHITIFTSLGILLPLECSNRHKAALSEGTVRSSKIIKRGEEYFVSVLVKFEPDARECKYIMGVDRGIYEIAAYAVIDKSTGEVVCSGKITGMVLRDHQRLLEKKQKLSQKKGQRIVSGWSNYTDNLMHHVANEIVNIANKWSAQVVLEDLSNLKNGPHHKRKKGARKGGFRHMLSRQQYGKLENMLEYKLQYLGLPKTAKVHAAGTSITCPLCGYYSNVNRIKDTEINRAIFHCQQCEHIAHSDINAAINIASKYLWEKAINGQLEKGKRLPRELLFNNWQVKHLRL